MICKDIYEFEDVSGYMFGAIHPPSPSIVFSLWKLPPLTLHHHCFTNVGAGAARLRV